MASENKTLKRGIELYIDGKPVLANMKQVETEAKKLREAIKGMTVGSKEYFEATKRYQELSRVLREHKNELKGIETQQQSLLSKGIQFFRDYSLQIAGAVAALTGISMKINAFRKQAAEKEDAAANLKALTGLDDDNIQWLTQQAEKLSTTMEASGLRVRKSATEILDAYMLVGSAKPELLKDKEALNAVTIEAMRLAEAAKMELKDSVDAVTIALNQFNAGADQAVRFTNVLAAGSKFGAANVEAQAAAIKNAGVAAASAGLTIEQLVGVIEMLGEKGIKAEEAGTALKGVFLKLQTGADDTNPAIVGLDKALENLAAKGMSAGEILNMFDRRGFNAAKILIDNTEKVKEYTTAVTDTSIAVEQAAINSDTAAAKLAQIRNQINLTGQELAKTLAPVISQSVGWTRKFVLALPPLIDYLKKYGLSTAALITTLILYNTYTKVATSTTSAWSAVIGFAKTQLTIFKGILLAYRTALTGSTTAQIEMTAAMKGTNIVTQIAAISVGLLKAAYYALSLQLTACVRTLKSVKVALAETGWGLVILAIGAVVSAVIRYDEKMKEARKRAEELRQAQKALYKEYDEAAARIKQLRKVAEDHTASLDDRRKAIVELQKLAPDYQASISTEGELIEKNKVKLDEYLERLKASIVLEAYKTKMSELLQKQMEAEEEQRKTSDEYWNIRQQNTLQGYNRNGLTAKLSRLFGTESEDNAHKAMHKAEEVLKEINKEIDDTEKRMKETADKWGFSLVDETPTGGTGEEPDTGTGGNHEETDKERKKRMALEAIDKEFNKRAADLMQQFLDEKIKKEGEYGAKMQNLEIERLQKQMDIAGLEPKKQEEIREELAAIDAEYNKQAADLKLRFLKGEFEREEDYSAKVQTLEQERLQKKMDVAGLEPKKQEEIREELAAIDFEYNKRATDLKQQLINSEFEKEEEYAAQRQALELKYLQNKMDVAGLEPKKQEEIRKELAAIDAAYDKRATELKQQFLNGEFEKEEEYATKMQALESERLQRIKDVAGLEAKRLHEEIREELAAIDAEYNKRAADLKQKFLDGEFEKEEDYAAKVQALELESLQKKMDVVGLEPEKQEEIRLKILEIKQKLVDELRKLDTLEGSEEERRLNEQLEKNRKAAQDRLNILESAKAAELLSEDEYNQRKQIILDKRAEDDKKAYEKMADEREKITRKGLNAVLLELRKEKASWLITEEEYNHRVRQARIAYLKQAIEDQTLSNEKREELAKELSEVELEEEEEKKEKIKEIYDDLKSYTEEFGGAIEDLVGDLMAGEEDALKEFGKTMLKMVVKAVKAMIDAYMPAVIARNIASKGLVAGLAVSALEIAAIEAAAGVLDGLIDGFEEGGFTPDGRKDEPQGIVHSNEFVANRFAVQNPQVLPVLQLIDAAQRSGSISNLTGQQIAAVATGSVSTPHNTRNVGNLPSSQQTISPDLTKAIKQLIYTTKKAAEAYKEPVQAYTFADGRGGVNEAQELLERMKRNASRKS